MASRIEEPQPALAAAAAQWKRRTRRRYLVASSDNDKLLMVRWSIVEEGNGVFMRLAEPHLKNGGGGMWAWSEVTTADALEDQALFVSRSCSVALRSSGYN